MTRSSVFLLKYILEGMKDKLFVIPDGGHYLKDIYRILKIAAKDHDSVVVFQAESGLHILDKLVIEQLQPSEDPPKIKVLY